MENNSPKRHPTTEGAPQNCPHCNSALWVKIPRNFWQKMLHPQQSRCFCRDCRRIFWRQRVD